MLEMTIFSNKHVDNFTTANQCALEKNAVLIDEALISDSPGIRPR
jgi:hypothetical protein